MTALREELAGFRDSFDAHTFVTPTLGTVYNPMQYAWAPMSRYLDLWASAPGPRSALFLGMNPGPWGMAQTGIPFGDVVLARDWIGVEAPVTKPPQEIPARPILGFDSTRREVSGTRLWGWAQERFGTPEAFFARAFVWNYCPLLFLDAERARNLTPDKLRKADRNAIFPTCDEMLRRIVTHLQPEIVLGVGAFSERRARAALPEEVRVGRVLHPSPASPAANRGWIPQLEAQLEAQGVVL